MIDGIDRPAICSDIPSKKNFSLMLDLGANVNVNADNLCGSTKESALLEKRSRNSLKLIISKSKLLKNLFLPLPK